MFSAGVPTPLPVALFSFMAASTPGFVGPLALMVSLVGQNSWLSRVGLFSSSIGPEWDDQPRPARSWSPVPRISLPRSWRWFVKSDLRSLSDIVLAERSPQRSWTWRQGRSLG